MRRKVAITGIGAVSALGVGMDALWAGMVEARSGLGPIERLDPSGFASRLGGEVGGFTARDHVPKTYRKAVKVMARDIELAVAAAAEAVADAGLVTKAGAGDGAALTYPAGRLGCQIGAGLIAADTTELSVALTTSLTEQDGEQRFSWARWGSEEGAEPGSGGAMVNLQPLWLLKYLPNMLACHVTILHGAEGPSNTLTCGEASGLLSAGEAARVIERGDAEACFAGGTEDKLNLMAMARMHLAGRLAATGDSADALSFCKPFDPSADGGLLGEGGSVVVLEAMDEARARDSKIYAEVAGFGAGQSGLAMAGVGDAEPPKVNEGLVVAIEAALADAGVSASDVDAVVPAAMGVAWLDTAEAGALRAVFGDRLASIPMVTTRPFVGECMAGGGALQLAVGAKMLGEQRLPARLHGSEPAPGIDAGACASSEAELRTVLVCSTSMGGQNAAVVLKAASN